MAKKAKSTNTTAAAVSMGLFDEGEKKPITANLPELTPIQAKPNKVPETATEQPKDTIKGEARRDYADYGELPEEQRLKLFGNKPKSLKQLKASKNNVG